MKDKYKNFPIKGMNCLSPLTFDTTYPWNKRVDLHTEVKRGFHCFSKLVAHPTIRFQMAPFLFSWLTISILLKPPWTSGCALLLQAYWEFWVNQRRVDLLLKVDYNYNGRHQLDSPWVCWNWMQCWGHCANFVHNKPIFHKISMACI